MNRNESLKKIVIRIYILSIKKKYFSFLKFNKKIILF